MPVYKDGDSGTWRAQFYYTDWTGKKHKKNKRGFRTKKEAQQYEAEYIRVAKADMDMKLSSFVDIYLQDKEVELKKRTLRNKRYMIDTHVIPFLGDKKMNEIAPADIIAWQKEIKENNDFSESYLRMLQNAHVDYVPVAHNYKRGLSMQPGLTKALEEMGLFQDCLEDLAEERTRLMMEKFGIDYHDSDYVDEKGKQLPKSKLTKEQLDNRKMASELVPCRTPQTKLQDLFRENLKAVMQEHSVPVAEVAKGDKEHLEKRGWADAMRAKAVTKEAKLEKAAIDNEIVQKTTELSELDEKLEQEKSDIKLIEDKRASLSSWDKKPKSEKGLFDQINKEVLDHKSLTGHKSKLVPLELWDVLKKIIKNYFRMEQENKSLRASTAMEKVKEAESIIDKKDKIISDAKDEADEIIAAGKKEVLSIRGKSQFIKENEELKSQLDIYDSVMERNPEFARAVEQEERKRKLFKVKGKKQEIAL